MTASSSGRSRNEAPVMSAAIIRSIDGDRTCISGFVASVARAGGRGARSDKKQFRSSWAFMGPHAVADGRRLHRPAPHTGVAARRVHQDVESAAVERGREDGVQKALTRYIQTVIKCHIKAADAAMKSMPFDEELCESNPSSGKGAKEKYDAAIAKLALTCSGQCAVLNAPGLRATVETLLD